MRPENFLNAADLADGREHGDQDTHREPTALQEFGRALAYTGIQSPLNGLAQLIDKPTGSDVCMKAVGHFIDAPSDSQSAASVLGSATATALHCGAMIWAGGKLGGQAAIGDVMGLGKRALATGALGTIYGGVFTPVTSGEKDFFTSRIENAVAGGVGLASMSAMTTVYHSWLGGPVGPGEPDAVLARFAFKGMNAISLPGVAGLSDCLSSTGDNKFSGGSVFTPSQRLKPVSELYDTTAKVKGR